MSLPGLFGGSRPALWWAAPPAPAVSRAAGGAATAAHGAPESFLRLCLAARRRADELEAAAALARSAAVDWPACLEAARAARVEPLLHDLFAGKGILPAAVEEQWRLAHIANAFRNALLFRELAGALALLGAAGVPAILLKGAALALAVYETPALRPMIDIDLLVRPADVPAALAALAAGGYEAAAPEARPGLTARFENEVCLVRPARMPVPLELHWGLLDSPHHQARIDGEWFWETARAAPPGALEGLPGPGPAARMLGPEAQLLHLCGHLVLHHAGARWQGERLLWQHDIAELLYRFGAGLDWDELLAKAAECDLVLPLQGVLPAVVARWGAPAPAGALERLGRLEPSAGERRAYGRLAAERGPVARRLIADLLGMPGWRGRLRYAASSLFPSAAYMRRRYGVRCGLALPLYYPYRWLLGLRPDRR